MIVHTTIVTDPTMQEDEGGWQWMVVIAAFFVQFIICGITYSLGILHVVFQDVFNEDHFDTAWAGSILLYVTAMTSVVFRCLMGRLGCRVCVMLGGAIAAGGLALSVFVTSMYQLYLTYGVMTGIGFGMACTPSIMIVEQHFHKMRFEAMSVAVGGIGAGIIVFPFIIRHLLDTYAWRGTLLILAGGALNLCVCGAAMTPVSKGKQCRLLPLLSCLPLRNPIFHGMCIANFFWSFGSIVIYMYLPAYSIELGGSLESSTILVACVGMASFTARSIFAFMGHDSALDDVTAVLCSAILGVVLTGVSPLMFEKYAGQVGYALLFGFYSGYWTTFLSQMSREMIGPEYIAMGNGYLCFMIALGSLLGGPCAGLLIQEKLEFQYAFYLAGASLLWSNIVMLLFKFKRCGPLPAVDYSCGDVKPPLLDDESKPFRAQTIDGEQILVESLVTSV